MSDEAEDRTDLFKAVGGRDEARLLLKDAVKSAANTTIWTRDQETTLRACISSADEESKQISVVCPEDQDPKEVTKVLLASNALCFFSAALDRASIFFKTEFKKEHEGNLLFEYPEQIFKVQRRKEMRFPIPEGLDMSVQYRNPLMPGQTLKTSVVDISAGGMAIGISASDSEFYQMGGELISLVFFVSSRKIECNADIRHVGENPTGSLLAEKKVGLSFKNIRTADSDAIAGYVFHESRKYFTKLF